MKYVLLQMLSGEMKIVDNSNHIGKGRVEKFCNEGAILVGTIESDLHPTQLRRGISHNEREAYEAENAKLWKLRNFINEL